MEAVNASSVSSIDSSIDIVNEFQSQLEAIVSFEKKLDRLKYEAEAKEKEGKKD
jgi:hypothetical protein